MQGTQVSPLVQGDPTCNEANKKCATSTEPTTHSYWSLSTLEPGLHREKPLLRKAGAPQLDNSPHLPQLEKVGAQQQRPHTAKKHTDKQRKKINL